MPARGASYGHQKIVIYGLNIGENNTAGLLPTAYVGKVPCLKTKILNRESVECTTPPGTGTQQVSLKVNGKFSTDNETIFEYQEPLIAHIYPAVGGQFGGEVITITGQFLGIDLAKPIITIGGQVCSGSKILEPGKKLQCIVPVSKTLGKEDVIISVNGVKSNATDFAKFEFVEANVTHDGSNAFITTFGSTSSFAPDGSSSTVTPVSFSADINSGNVRVLVTNATSDSVVFKFQRIVIDV